MEDKDSAISSSKQLIIDQAPCSNGMSYGGTASQPSATVLILVLMEFEMSFDTSNGLVLMENVLILVLMEFEMRW